MLMAQTAASVPCIRMGWADSSLQLGRDWLHISHNRIELRHLKQVCDAVDALCKWNQELVSRSDNDDGENVEDDGDEVKQDEILAYHKILVNYIRRRNHVPVNMSRGFTKLVHKVSALCWSWGLDTIGLASLLDFMDSTVSLCTDMGTELGAVSFQLTSVKNVLPPWQVEAMMPIISPEDDAAEVAVLFDPLRSVPLPPPLKPPALLLA